MTDRPILRPADEEYEATVGPAREACERAHKRYIQALNNYELAVLVALGKRDP